MSIQVRLFMPIFNYIRSIICSISLILPLNYSKVAVANHIATAIPCFLVWVKRFELPLFT